MPSDPQPVALRPAVPETEPTETEPTETEPTETEPTETEPTETEPTETEPTETGTSGTRPSDSPTARRSSPVPHRATGSTPAARPLLASSSDISPQPPHGPGSALPLHDGSAPSPEFTIKGNAGSMLFHPPSSPYYARTKAEVWFRTPEDATAAGFTAYAPRRRAPS